MPQVLNLVSDHGELSSNDATTVASGAKAVKSGILYIACSSEKKSGHISVCNTIAQAGVGSFHVEKGGDFLYRYGHPAHAKAMSVSKANPCVITLDRQDTKFRVGDYITMTGSSVGAYNSTIAHKEITAIQIPDRVNGYTCKLTVDANTSSLADFTGTAELTKTVIFRLAPETSDGSTMHLHEVNLG
jgi:hypothetical protein|tara:strand:+ start:686 stop:1246 length:561 start_codon:yes stop_codon:yes gene_type:complete